MKEYKWGILAPGNIARSFATALNGIENAELYCVASRSKERAQQFANEFNATTVAASYSALINDPHIDVVYIASPHHVHAEQSIACLKAGKAVLCEKPMTVNCLDAQTVIDTAKQENRFYMEAVWTRFLPIYSKIRNWINNDRIGDVQMVQASFGFAVPFDANSRIYNADLAGGCLLDMGIYPITFAQLILGGSPDKIAALSHIGDTGVDEHTGIVLHFSDGKIATLNSSLKATTSCDAWIFGSKGRIHVPQFWFADKAILYTGNQLPHTVTETASCPHAINGYEYEIYETHRCLEQGLTQSPTLPWRTSLNIMNIMDEVRQQVGLTYPSEN